MYILHLFTLSRNFAAIQKVLTVNSAFTDEPNAVSAVEIVPVSIVDEASAVLTFVMAMGPVVGLTGSPVPERAATSVGPVALGSYLNSATEWMVDSRVCRHGAVHPFPDIFRLFVGESQPEITFSCNCVPHKLLRKEEHNTKISVNERTDETNCNAMMKVCFLLL